MDHPKGYNFDYNYPNPAILKKYEGSLNSFHTFESYQPITGCPTQVLKNNEFYSTPYTSQRLSRARGVVDSTNHESGVERSMNPLSKDFNPKAVNQMGNQHSIESASSLNDLAHVSVMKDIPLFRDDVPDQIELVLRQRSELRSKTVIVQRIINRLSKVSHMTDNQLFDLIATISSYHEELEKLESNHTKYIKALITSKHVFDKTHPELYLKLKGELLTIDSLSNLFQDSLDKADLVISKKQINSVKLSTDDVKELTYLTFSGSLSYKEPHVFQFLARLEENFKLCRTPNYLRAHILKENLSGYAKLIVPLDETDYKKIVLILQERFGSTIVIHNSILKCHRNVGNIPSKLCVNPNWEKIESVSRLHLSLIRKAEAMVVDESSYTEIFSSAERNFILISLLPHEDRENLQKNQSSIDQTSLYKIIVQTFERIQSTASMNADLSMHGKFKADSESNLHETKTDMPIAVASGLEDEKSYFSDHTDGDSDQKGEDYDDFDDDYYDEINQTQNLF